ncbi:MAG: hypothetical protein KatS3mg076_2398 [Candidatus Binatia bacterium]|nr:MAG: hypothetical protein KatS3mg076_2398 [Candidatus Binatia bacterium]
MKYGPTVRRCAHCLFERGQSFASVTGSPTLDELHRRFGVRSARPLFFERHDHEGLEATLSFYSRIAKSVRRFPRRAQRAPRGVLLPDLSNVFVLELDSPTDVLRAAREYAKDPAVVYAEPDYLVGLAFLPDDPFFASSGTWGQAYEDLWGLHRTQASDAWDVSAGAGTIVAVIDTGVDYNHPDISANIWTNPGEIPGNGVDDDGNGFVDDVRGWDFDQDDNNPMDNHGHGTHVAGIAAATGNNGFGVLGMAWQAQVMPVKGIGASGFGFDSDLAASIVYAAENGADVLNNSWGGFGSSSLIADAVETARALGAVVVAAAGNEATDVDNVFPAALDGVIAVGATEPDDTHASFSNRGDALSVSAPGVDILSLRGSNSAPTGG